jgi:hypothetical protein
MVAQAMQNTASTAWPSNRQIQITDARAFCRKINSALDQAGFDAWLDGICRPYLNGENGRSPVALGSFFRLIVCSYLSERCFLDGAENGPRSARAPLEIFGVSGLLPASENGNPASAVYRLPLDVHRRAFSHAIEIIGKSGLLDHGSVTEGPHRLNRRTLPPGPIHKETGDDWCADWCRRESD